MQKFLGGKFVENVKKKKAALRKLTITAMGIALFVVMTLCLQVPVFENYYLCLGYVAMTFYCYAIGTASGTIVGTFGVILYCLLTGGTKGMPGWAAGNLVLGIILGITFWLVRKIKKTVLEGLISTVVIIMATAFAMLVVKSYVEYLLYYEPFVLRVAKNIYAFVADAFVIIISLPICRLLEPKLKAITSKYF